MASIKLLRPHSPGQEDLIVSQSNDVVFAGRRWGKTHTGVQRIVRSSLQDVGLYWWVGLGWKSASLKRAWRELKAFAIQYWTALKEKPERYIRESAKELTLPGGSEIWMRTAERPDSLAGEGIRGCVLDEFTLMQELVWTEYVEATLLDHQGWAMFIGVPKGNNWGARLWRNCETGPPGMDWRPGRKGWRAHHYPTSSNPYISIDALDDIRLHTPTGLFEQEYLAKVIDHAGAVFTNIGQCLGSEELSVPQPGHVYIFGLDWGKTTDFTCVPIVDVGERRLVHLARFNGMDYPAQLENIRQLCTLWEPRNIVAEANAMGEPLCDQLIQDGLPLQKFYTTNTTKREIIEALQVGFEQGHIQIFAHDVLMRELEEYTATITAMGNIRYSAPPGGHDDCVMSLALAWNEVRYDLGISF